MKSVNQYCDGIKANGTQSQTGIGSAIYRTFHPSERYMIDFADDFTAEGWEQFDTDQDAHYFGVWVNPKTRQVLTYAEGDWSLTESPDHQLYNAEIQRMIEFYGEGFICKAYGADGAIEYRQDRSRFLIQS
jgi:hypothetical protein